MYNRDKTTYIVGKISGKWYCPNISRSKALGWWCYGGRHSGHWHKCLLYWEDRCYPKAKGPHFSFGEDGTETKKVHWIAIIEFLFSCQLNIVLVTNSDHKHRMGGGVGVGFSNGLPLTMFNREMDAATINPGEQVHCNFLSLSLCWIAQVNFHRCRTMAKSINIYLSDGRYLRRRYQECILMKLWEGCL